MAFCIGVDIGGTTVKLGIFEPEGKKVDKWEIPTRTQDEGVNILPDIAKTLEEKLLQLGFRKEDCIGIGVGVPAPVTKEGVVNGTANLGWKYKEVKKELEELTGITSVIGNDANVAALGEMWQGGGKGKQDLVMVTLGTGVGSGFIVGGKLIVGSHGAGGEGGHIRVNYEETDLCGCGNRGCLEQYASATGIVRLAKKKLAEETRKTVLTKEEVTAKSVFDAVKKQDPVAMEIAEEFGTYLAYGLSNMAAVSDPSVFVIGGGVSKAGSVLIDYVEKKYREVAFFANRDVEFALASLGNDAGIIGAAKLALDSIK